ncbi:prepilin peptidase [Candidatus Peribacteria bacterium]|nr:prepilin peptidase [Candidatus Peribacteria bacterium]
MPIHPAFVVIILAMGISMGSFGNVLLYRLPLGRSIGGRSRCPHCKHVLSPWELVPLMSFMVLGARCRKCRRPISWQYPLVEAAAGAVFLIAFFREFPSIPAVALLGLCLWLLLLIAVVDAKTATIPDAFNIPFLLLAVLRSFVAGEPFLIAMVIGAGFFASQWAFSKGRWVGSGDIILAAGIGALLAEVRLILLALWVAYISGAIVAVFMLSMKKKKMRSRLAFGPFLVAGAMVAFLFGERVLGMVGL